MSDDESFVCEECGTHRPVEIRVIRGPDVCSNCFDGEPADRAAAGETAGPGTPSAVTETRTGAGARAGDGADGAEQASAEPEHDEAGGPVHRDGALRFWKRSEAARLSVVEHERHSTDPDGDGEDDDGSSELDRRIDSWKEQLLDLTRRNNLIDFAETKTKSLPLHRPDALAIAETLVEGDTVYVRKSEEGPDGSAEPPSPATVGPNEVASTRTRAATEESLYRMDLKQRRAREEKGVDALHVAFGFLEWYAEERNEDPMTSPLFVLAVDLERTPTRSADQHDFRITAQDLDLRLNPALRKKLEAERSLYLPADETFLLDELGACMALVEDRVQGYDRWTLYADACLGIFDFTKVGLYQDIEANREAVKQDPLIKGINGDPSALQSPPETPRAQQLDEVVPSGDVYQVLDADSSQQEAIEAAKRGMDFVLQGPPGTGKSQTIANIIAEKLADGESVLFVSEKQAALDVVKDRLDDVGVGRFCLEAHGENASKKAVLESFESELKSTPIKHPAERADVVEELDAARETLNDYGEELFWSPEGQEITPYEAFGGVARHADRPTFDLEFEDPLGIDQDTIDGWFDTLETLANYQFEIVNYGSHPWRATTIDTWKVNTREEVDRILETSTDAAETVLAASEAFEDAVGIDIRSFSGIRDAGHLLDLLVRRPAVDYEESLFDERFYDQPDRLAELADLRRERAEHRGHLADHYDDTFRSESGQELYNDLQDAGALRTVKPSYRRLRSRILDHAEPGYDPDHDTLLEDVRHLMQLQRLDSELADYAALEARLGGLHEGPDTDWDQVLRVREWVDQFEAIDSVLRDPLKDALRRGDFDDGADLDALRETVQATVEKQLDALDELAAILDLDAVRVQDTTIDKASPEAVAAWLEHLAANQGALQDWVEFSQRLEDAREGTLADYLEAFLDGDEDPADLLPSFERAFYTQWLNAAYDETDLDRFSATEFGTVLERFRRLDRQQQEYAKVAIQHAVTKEFPRVELEHADSSEQVFLRREINKSRQHKPLRTLFREVPSLATTLKPCFMMSPLSVAQYVEYGTISFDAVIFDEASQVMPQDAVSSLIRADQVVIAGDSQQLPPTEFFEAAVDSAEDVPTDLESILDEAASVLPERQLRWHYRSRTNDLIDFSNRHYYEGKLRTFPDTARGGGENGVRFEHVPDGVYDRGGTRANKREAERVVDLLEEHVEERSDRSLGVVAFSASQADAIREEVEARRGDASELDSFVGRDDTLEGFFVKSLENVQGDERDDLIFSVGYGPDEDGDLTMNFGPLNHTGGERRLNVAVTRARERITVVSSITHEDIDLARTESRGVADFKEYLAYAQGEDRAGVGAGDADPTEAFDDPFPAAVYRALDGAGFDVRPHVQSSGYGFDMAIADPDDPDTAVLAIECDGSAYQASKTARDRDRTRQAVLTSLGWELHRVWAPDWASNRDAELDAIADAVDRLAEGDPPSLEPDEPDVYELDPEPMDAEAFEPLQDHLEPYRAPEVTDYRYGDYDDAAIDNRKEALRTVVEEWGPITTPDAHRQSVRAWDVDRVSASMREDMEKIAWDLKRDGDVVERDGFLWAADHDGIVVRPNTRDDKRPIDDIPLEELAKAGYLLLDNGGAMTRDDVVVEVARLFGYDRTGSRIAERIGDSVDLLLDVDVAAETESDRLEAVGRDVDEALLD
jgi:hypothetical protein